MITLRGRPRPHRREGWSAPEQGATSASSDWKVISVRRPTRTVSSLRSRISPQTVVLPRPVILQAVATVTVSGFNSGGCGSGNSRFTSRLSAVLVTLRQAPSGAHPDSAADMETGETACGPLAVLMPEHACVAEAGVNRLVRLHKDIERAGIANSLVNR
jgi:hypothetical protein